MSHLERLFLLGNILFWVDGGEGRGVFFNHVGNTKEETHTVTMITVPIYVLLSTTRSLDFSNLSSCLGGSFLQTTHFTTMLTISVTAFRVVRTHHSQDSFPHTHPCALREEVHVTKGNC